MLNPNQALKALGIELADLHDAEVLPEGTHPLAGTLELAFSGAVEQGPGIMAAQNLTLPLPLVLAILSEAGVKADVLTQTVIKAAALAAKEKKPVSEQIDLWTGAIKDARELVLAKLPKVPKKGALRRILTISDVLVQGTGLEAVAVKKLKRKSA